MVKTFIIAMVIVVTRLIEISLSVILYVTVS